MPRPASTRVKPFTIEATSPSRIEHMFDLRPDDIADMVANGLPVYSRGLRRRIIVEDVKRALRKWPRAKPRHRNHCRSVQ